MTTAFVTVLRGDIAGAAQVIGAGTWSTVQFDIVEGDGENVIYSPTTFAFTAPYTGWYVVDAHVEYTTTADGIRIIKDGNGAFPIFMEATAGVAANDIHHILFLAKNEFINIQVFSAAGTNIDAVDTLGGVASRITNATFVLIKTT